MVFHDLQRLGSLTIIWFPFSEAWDTAGALLNPYLRKAYFTERWIGDAAAYIMPILVKNKNTWENKYR